MNYDYVFVISTCGIYTILDLTYLHIMKHYFIFRIIYHSN